MKKVLLAVLLSIILVSISVSAEPSWAPILEGNINRISALCQNNFCQEIWIFSYDLNQIFTRNYITFNTSECYEIIYSRIGIMKINYGDICSREFPLWVNLGNEFTIYSDEKSCLKGNHHKYKVKNK